MLKSQQTEIETNINIWTTITMLLNVESCIQLIDKQEKNSNQTFVDSNNMAATNEKYW